MARPQNQKNTNAPVGARRVQKRTVIGEVQILTATGEIFNHVDQGLPMWSGHGDRNVTVDIVFSAPFAAPPAVSLGLTGIDSAHDQNLRIRLITRNVTATGFTIECSTWHDTHIASAEISWQAIGAAETKAAAETIPKP